MDDAGIAADLVVHQEFDATPEQVFAGFLDMYGRLRPDWIESSELDLHVGGRWDVVFRPPGVARFSEHRLITALERPRLLEYRAAIVGQDAPIETPVRIVIDPNASGARLTLSQSGFPDAQTRDDFATAWRDVFRLLADQVADDR